MAGRVRAIDDEIRVCMSQLQGMGHSQEISANQTNSTFLGAAVPEITRVTDGNFQITIRGNPIQIRLHDSFVLGNINLFPEITAIPKENTNLQTKINNNERLLRDTNELKRICAQVGETVPNIKIKITSDNTARRSEIETNNKRLFESEREKSMENANMKRLFDGLLNMKAFKEWCHTFDPLFFEYCTMTSITIQSIDIFPPPRFGFVKFITDLAYKPTMIAEYKARALVAYNLKEEKEAKEKKRMVIVKTVDEMSAPHIPGIVFMRGGAVTVLTIITTDSGMRWSLLVVQPRAAVGKFYMNELPAGMIDDEDNFGGAAAKELQEETGLRINASDLEDLTEELDYDKAYPSCGACDEFMKFYLYRCKLGKKKFEALQNKCTGAFEEGENIKVKVVPFDRLAEYSPDMKTLSALYLYEQRCKRRAQMYSTYGGGRIIGQTIPDEAKLIDIPDDKPTS